MPLAVMMLQIVVGAGVVGVADVRCVDAARTAARMAARGEPAALVLAAARAAAPSGAAVQAESEDGGLVRVVVRARVSLPLPLRPGIGLSAASTAALETANG